MTLSTFSPFLFSALSILMVDKYMFKLFYTKYMKQAIKQRYLLLTYLGFVVYVVVCYVLRRAFYRKFVLR